MSLGNSGAAVGEFLLVFVTVLHSIAAIMTCLRLWARARLHRIWWEDAWAALALCFDVIYAVATWVLSLPHDPWYPLQKSQTVSAWLTLLSYTCLIWSVRMSIMFSLIRMLRPSVRVRSISCCFAALFFVLWALSTSSKVYMCSMDRSWYNHPRPRCPIGVPVATIEFASDIASDIVLVALPTRVLCRVRLLRNERILILSILSMGVLTVLASIVHIAFLIPVPGSVAGMTADIEGAVDLMICNLLVLVTSWYRFFRDGVDIEYMDDDPDLMVKPVESLQTAMDTLTTVDLERLESMSIHSSESAPTPETETSPMHSLSLRSSFDHCTTVEHT